MTVELSAVAVESADSVTKEPAKVLPVAPGVWVSQSRPFMEPPKDTKR